MAREYDRDRYESDWERNDKGRHREHDQRFSRGSDYDQFQQGRYGWEGYGSGRYGSERYGGENYGRGSEFSRGDYDDSRREYGSGGRGMNEWEGSRGYNREGPGGGHGYRGMNQWEGDRGYERGEYGGQYGGRQSLGNQDMSNWNRGGNYGREGFGRQGMGQWEGSSRGYNRGYSGGQYRSGPSWGDQGMNEWGSGMGQWEGGHSYGGGQPRGSRGRFFGVGPQGYQRADDRIMEDINDRLTWHGDIDASNIQVKVEKGIVTLTGTVDDRWTKRAAEDVAESVRGILDVHNQIQVRRPQDMMQQGSQNEMSQSDKQAATAQSSTQSTTTRRNAQTIPT